MIRQHESPPLSPSPTFSLSLREAGRRIARRAQGRPAGAPPCLVQPAAGGRAVRARQRRGAALGDARAGHATRRAARAGHARGRGPVRHDGRDHRRRRADSVARPGRVSGPCRTLLHAPRDGGRIPAHVSPRARNGHAARRTNDVARSGMTRLHVVVGMTAIQRAFEKRPLLAVVVLAASVRVVAAVFSRGFLAIDDHHVLVDAADRLVGGPGLDTGFVRSILYPGTVALIMRATQAIDDPSPATQLLVVRLVQAVYSLCAVYFAYRVLERLAGPRTALLGGLLTATFFVLPITSVHQFEEAVCQVPLLASAWWILKTPEPRRATLLALLSGTALGLALVVRFPLITFVVPFTLWVVWREPVCWRAAALLALVTLVLSLQR